MPCESRKLKVDPYPTTNRIPVSQTGRTAKGTAISTAALGTGEQGRHSELPRVLPRPAPTRPTRSSADRLRRRPWPHPRDRGMLPALGASALSRPQAAQPAEQDARGSVAGVQGARQCLLPGRLAVLAHMLRDDIAATYGAAMPS